MPIVSATNSLAKTVFAVNNNNRETNIAVFKIILLQNICNSINHENKVPSSSFVVESLVLFSLDFSGENSLLFVSIWLYFIFEIEKSLF